ncbi:MAG: hypothetical protein R6V83_04980 [Candidatus Thorarchaeota archaeon]
MGYQEGVEDKLALLEERIIENPKTIRWRVRAFLGRKLPVRKVVEEENLKVG